VEVLKEKQRLIEESDGSRSADVMQILECFREELDDHLLSINENTSEVESNYEHIRGMAEQLEKMAQRLDELTLLVKGKSAKKEFSVKPLTTKEKQVFQALYVLGQEQPFATYKVLSKKLGMSEGLVQSYVTNLAEKGVAIVKRYQNNQVWVKIDDKFRAIQAKKNLVGLDFALTNWIEPD